MILEGTTSSGAVVPVQVTADGKVVAEGRTGPEGPQGTEGPEGPQGPEGPAGSPGNLWSGSDPGPIYYSGGSVGIGTSTAGTLLELDGGSDGQVAIRLRSDGGSANGSVSDITSIGTGTNASALTFSTRNATDGIVEVMRINSAQHVGIGTTGPAANLHVNAASGDVTGRWSSTGNTVVTHLAGTSDTAALMFGDSADAFIGQIRYENSDDSMSFVVNNSTRATIDSSGRLLVGTTTAPAGTLSSDVVCQGAIVLQSPNGTWWAIEVEDDGTLSVSQTSVR